MSSGFGFLEQLEAWFRSQGMAVRLQGNVLLVDFVWMEEKYPLVIEVDDTTGFVRGSIVSEVEVPYDSVGVLLEKNFYAWGCKIGVDPEGFLFVGIELPLDCVLPLGPSGFVDRLGYMISVFRDVSGLLEHYGAG